MEGLGLIALLVLLTATQELFLETHRRRYHHWRSTRERRLWASLEERRMMWDALTHRDPDARVELSRLILIGVVVIVFAGLVVLGPAGLAQRR